MIASLYVWAHWIGWGRLAVAAAFWMMVTLVVMNSLIIFDVPVVDVMFRIEPWIKEEVLGSTSNNPFRIAVLEAAIDEFAARVDHLRQVLQRQYQSICAPSAPVVSEISPPFTTTS